jgi:hypothetical protein
MYPYCKKAALIAKNKKAILEQLTAILEQHIILSNTIFNIEIV